MDLNKIFIKNASPTKVGGQAVLEGIMMKGADRTAVVVRQGNGKLHVKTERLKTKGRLQKIPFLRGVFIFVDSLVTGTRTLLYSAEVLEEGLEEEEKKDKLTLWLERRFGEKAALNAMLYASVVLAILFTVGFFIIGPTAVVSLFKYFTQNEVVLNLIEGAFRICIFVLYIFLISKMQDIRTVFQFHGAEHKCIHCYENGLPLTPENAQSFQTLHPRCGTSFLMFVMIISLLLFSLLGWPGLLWRIGSRLLLVPVIAGISYELLRWAGKSDSILVKVLSLPGLLLQKLTTREPDEKQLEVAIAAMKAVLVPKDAPTIEGECDKEGQLIERKEDGEVDILLSEQSETETFDAEQVADH